MSAKTKINKTQKLIRDELDKIIMLIPGYDPHRDSAGYHFEPERALEKINFIETYLRHVEGEKAGQKFILERWEKAIIANIFGWYDKNGNRRYKEVFLYIPRKNGKTTLSAAIAAVILFTDKEMGMQLYSAAADASQAKLVFRQLRGMIEQEKELFSRCKIFRDSITIEEIMAVYRAISSVGATKHGANIHLAIIDELHAQKNRELVDALITSTGARRNSLIIYVTTADYTRESICNEKYKDAVKVRDGIIKDPNFLPIIYELKREEDWKDEKNWFKCNPNLDITVPLSNMRREFNKAVEQPAYEATFKRLYLNQQTSQDRVWIPYDVWTKCKRNIDIKTMGDRPCYIGVDLSATTDITSVALIFASYDNNEAWQLFTYNFVPEKTTSKKTEIERKTYQKWIDQNKIITTPGNVVDYDYIRNKIIELSKEYNVRQIAFDPHNATYLQVQMMGMGFDIIPFGQGFISMSPAAKEFEKRIYSQKIYHNGDEVMDWMLNNTQIERDAAGNIKPSKKASANKIDATVAAVMATGIAMLDMAKNEVQEDNIEAFWI